MDGTDMKAALAAALLWLPCAATAATEWDVRDADHPVLGPIRVAVPRNGTSTVVRDLKIVSAAFVSCEKRASRIAIELANSLESDTRGGLPPAENPRLVCSAPGLRPQRSYTANDIPATWESNELGDMLARGLSPAALRQCGSIDIVQSVKLPEGAAAKSQAVSMSLAPNGRDLDSVFVACGEKTAFPATAPAPAVRSSAPESAAAPSGWSFARTAAQGRTNVRKAASVDSPAVAQLPPGARVLVQKDTGPWWKVKPTKGAGFAGYVREDRLVIE